MNKTNTIETILKEFEHKFYGANDPKVLDMKAFLSSALIRLEREGLQKGYKQGYSDMKDLVTEEIAKLKDKKNIRPDDHLDTGWHAARGVYGGEKK